MRVISTASVPPQRRDWWTGELLESESPTPELQTKLFEQVETCSVSMAKAALWRSELLEERKRVKDKYEMWGDYVQFPYNCTRN
jgi:hypothetical protein